MLIRGRLREAKRLAPQSGIKESNFHGNESRQNGIGS
jgi:hypothetical protein